MTEERDATAVEASGPTGGLPAWLSEIFPAGGRPGFYEKLGSHAACFVDRGAHQLVVSFDNLSDAGNPNYDVEPWAAKFIQDRGWSHLGILAPGPSWYRDKRLIGFLEKLAASGFFRQFDRVALMGTSIGAFASLVFADLTPGATVIALSPQSTLDTSVVPWETRFGKGRVQDWTLPYSDAAAGLRHTSKVYVLFDPFVAPDLAHVQRLPQSQLTLLKGFWFGHKTAVVLRRLDSLKPIMTAAVEGTLTEQEFYRLIRDRKNLLLYRRNVEAHLKDRGRDGLVEVFRNAFQSRRRQRLADGLE